MNVNIDSKESCLDYCIFSNKRRGALKIFVILGAVLIRGRRLFRNLKILILKYFYNSTNLVESWILHSEMAIFHSITLPLECNEIDL